MSVRTDVDWLRVSQTTETSPSWANGAMTRGRGTLRLRGLAVILGRVTVRRNTRRVGRESRTWIWGQGGEVGRIRGGTQGMNGGDERM